MSCTQPQPNENEYSPSEIYKTHSEFIYNTILFHVKDENLAEELFQEYYLHLNMYPPPQNLENIEAFLRRSIALFIIGFYRKRNEYRARIRAYAWQRRSQKKDDRPEKAVSDAEEAEKMLTLIEKRLPRRESAAIIERYKHERDVAETAKILGVSVRSVSHYVSYGLSKIQRMFLVGDED